MSLKYKKYLSTAGLSTSEWGPSGWYFLFACIMGSYPSKIDNNNKEHIRIKKEFKNMLNSLSYTMPCIFCKISYKQFCKDLPIEVGLVGRIELMHWLYQIKDRVNKKLMLQELECFNDNKSKIDIRYKNNNITKIEYNNLVNNLKKNTFITSKSPTFINVLNQYESIRAKCSTKSKTCR